MNILITGAAGRLGRAVRLWAEKDGHDTVLLDQSESILAGGGIQAKITDRDAIFRAAEGCEAIVHTAAMHGSSYGREPNIRFLETNVLSAEHLFQAALKHGVKRLVMASSLEVIIGKRWSAYGTAVVDESLPPRPDWIYPVTKRQVEVLGQMYAQHHGLEVVQLRYMAFGDKPLDQLGLALLSRYMTANDAGHATYLAATRAGLKDEILHIGPETPLTQADVNEALKDPEAVLERYWPGSVAVLREHGHQPKPEHFWPVTSITRAKQALDWQPRETFEALLRSLGWQAA